MEHPKKRNFQRIGEWWKANKSLYFKDPPWESFWTNISKKGRLNSVNGLNEEAWQPVPAVVALNLGGTTKTSSLLETGLFLYA